MADKELIENEPGADDEYEESGSDYGYIEKTQRKVFIDKDEYSIFETHRRYKRGDIYLRPFYQRGSVWYEKKKSRLIESIILNIPIQVIYLAEKEDGKREVIDGQQRLSTIFDFLDDKFKLTGLSILGDLKNMNFSDIVEKHTELQRKLEDYMLSFFIIKKESHMDIRFDIFERVNAGATTLNAQELRNSTHRGKGIEFLKKLSKDTFFKKMTHALPKDRLKDQEAVLRFLAFYINGYESYNGNLNSFLNNTLDGLNAGEDQFGKLENVFLSTMKTIYDAFGEDAFIKAESSRKKVNLSLFDILGYSFNKFESEQIIVQKEAIKESLERLIDEKGDFYYAVTSNTLTKSNVKIRFEQWLSRMESCINGGES